MAENLTLICWLSKPYWSKKISQRTSHPQHTALIPMEALIYEHSTDPRLMILTCWDWWYGCTPTVACTRNLSMSDPGGAALELGSPLHKSASPSRPKCGNWFPTSALHHVPVLAPAIAQSAPVYSICSRAYMFSALNTNSPPLSLSIYTFSDRTPNRCCSASINQQWTPHHMTSLLRSASLLRQNGLHPLQPWPWRMRNVEYPGRHSTTPSLTGPPDHKRHQRVFRTWTRPLWQRNAKFPGRARNTWGKFFFTIFGPSKDLCLCFFYSYRHLLHF